ncbi:HAMP domain-containing protein, partial [bacterium]|nr:HAMP domain-containing protein [bacterium]
MGEQAGALAASNERSAAAAAQDVNAAISRGLTVTAALVAMAMALGVVSGLLLVNRKLAAGRLELRIPALNRGDEIGAMGRSLEVFRANAMEVLRLKAEQEAADRRAEADKRAAQQQLANQLETSVNSVIVSVLDAAGGMRDDAQALSANA